MQAAHDARAVDEDRGREREHAISAAAEARGGVVLCRRCRRSASGGRPGSARKRCVARRRARSRRTVSNISATISRPQLRYSRYSGARTRPVVAVRAPAAGERHQQSPAAVERSPLSETNTPPRSGNRKSSRVAPAFICVARSASPSEAASRCAVKRSVWCAGPVLALKVPSAPSVARRGRGWPPSNLRAAGGARAVAREVAMVAGRRQEGAGPRRPAGGTRRPPIRLAIPVGEGHGPAVGDVAARWHAPHRGVKAVSRRASRRTDRLLLRAGLDHRQRAA